MNGFKIFVFILTSSFIASSSFADIYEWTDANGIKHYTNQTPPPDSGVLMKTKEEPYDETADRARMAIERQERLELAHLEIARQEAELKLREAEAEQKLAEAERLAQQATLEDNYHLGETYSRNWVISRGGGYRCRDDRWDCNYLDYNRWYYQTGQRRSTYQNKLYHLTPYQSYQYIKKHYGSNRKIDHNRYRGRVRSQPNTRSRHKGHYSGYNLSTRSTHNYKGYRGISRGSRSGGYKGPGNFSRGWSGSGMRR